MPGFERTRFVGLADNIAKDLTCVVCLNIFDNPLITDCGHTYCCQCLQSNIENGRKDCPKCRKQVANKNSSQYLANDNCVVIEIGEQSLVFVRNLIVNSMVSHLEIKCDYESNGCQTVVELDSLAAHLKQCEHRVCKSCGFLAGKVTEHDCLAFLINELNNYKQRFEKNDRLLIEIVDKYSKLEKQNKTNIKIWRMKCSKYELKIQELSNKLSLLEDSDEKKSSSHNFKASMFIEGVDFVMFGTLETKCLHCQIDRTGIDLKGVSHDYCEDIMPTDVFIPFKKIQELKYCCAMSTTVIVIKPIDSYSFDVQRLLYIDRVPNNKFGFCIYSYGLLI